MRLQAVAGALVAPSFNGRTADSGSAYRGSNPWGAAMNYRELSIGVSGQPAIYLSINDLWRILSAIVETLERLLEPPRPEGVPSSVCPVISPQRANSRTLPEPHPWIAS